MKTTKYYKLMAAAMMIGAPMLWSSCTDTWNDHYDANSSANGEGTLLSHLAADPSLANFYKVITTIGGAETLDSPQQFTVWAPTNLTSAQADSVIAVYKADVANGIKTDDNKAITQFMQNHVALYSRPVSAYTNDTIKMLSNKYMQLKGTSSTTGTLNSVPFNGMELCNNGILYKTSNVMTFFPNVRQYVEQNSNMDSLKSFITSFDEYELDENSSVPGEIVDGKQVYLDSVTNLTNKMLTKYGFIQREDSSYLFVAPTDKVWKELYEKYQKYYTYDPSVQNADSLRNINTHHRILEGRVFDISSEWQYNQHPTDSLCNTQYKNIQSHYPRQNVYYNPASSEGILNGLTEVECSNGYVYVDDKGVIDPRSTFFGRQDIEAYSPRYYEIPTNSNNEETMNVDRTEYVLYTDSTMSEIQKTYYFAKVTAKTSSAQTALEYKIPELLSGCYYNIYLVTIPNDNKLPGWFVVQHMEKNDKGAFPSDYTSSSYYNNPDPITAERTDVANVDVILKQSNNQRIFVTQPEKIDTILIQSGVQFPWSGIGLSEGQVKFKISSVGPSSSSYREKIYTRTLQLNELLFVPYETKEEAEAAKYDRDAINDAILQANSKK